MNRTGPMSSIRERNKELILRAASEEFAEKGFAASKTSDIADRAGLPKPNVYYYFKSKENLYREVHACASKVFASEIMHGAPHLPAERAAQLNAQAAHNVACIQGWIDKGLMAAVDPHHLMFSIWAATQTYADFDWQISTVTGKTALDDADYEAAAETITRMVIKGCEVKEANPVG